MMPTPTKSYYKIGEVSAMLYVLTNKSISHEENLPNLNNRFIGTLNRL